MWGEARNAVQLLEGTGGNWLSSCEGKSTIHINYDEKRTRRRCRPMTKTPPLSVCQSQLGPVFTFLTQFAPKCRNSTLKMSPSCYSSSGTLRSLRMFGELPESWCFQKENRRRLLARVDLCHKMACSMTQTCCESRSRGSTMYKQEACTRFPAWKNTVLHAHIDNIVCMQHVVFVVIVFRL